MYFLPVYLELVTKTVKRERPDGIPGTFGGLTALDLAARLEEQEVFEKYRCRVLETSIHATITTEGRVYFRW